MRFIKRQRELARIVKDFRAWEAEFQAYRDSIDFNWDEVELS
jgi:hypothetical protein